MNNLSFDVVGFAQDEADAEERPFDPWRSPCTPKADALVQKVLEMLEAHEQLFGLRQRKRRAVDQVTFEKTVAALTCDLAVSTMSEDSKAIYITRSHRELGHASRYGSPASSKTLPTILDRLADERVGLIHMVLGYRKDTGDRKKTSIRPSHRFRRLVQEFCLLPSDIAELQRPEPIELKSFPPGQGKKAPRIDYEDTDQTIKLRQEMHEINRHLLAARIDYTGQAVVDINRRQLRRSFTRRRFDSGGRLFGGFWQQMKKEHRLQHIKINGEDVVELDYGQTMPRLVYALVEREPPMTDLYAIPGFEKSRDGVKRVMAAMLFVEQPLSRFPQGTRKLFPRQTRVQDVTDGVIAAHPEIASKLFRGVGHHCQFLESQILVEVLRILNGMGVTALPIHDAVLVPASASSLAERVMLYTFKRKTGIDGKVTIHTTQQHQVENHPLAA
jgi:hypothetical protein